MPTNSSVNTRSQTYANAKRFSEQKKYIDYGMCLMWARTMANIPAKYGYALLAAKHASRRMGTPPAGTFVYFKHRDNRRDDLGHISISAGKGYTYTTDYPKANRVGKTKINTLSSRWGLQFIGWSDECNDFRLRAGPTPPAPKPGPRKPRDLPQPRARIVFDSKIHPGQKHSDSVWWVQYALNKLKLKGAPRLTLTGTYGRQTKAVVKLLQAQKFGDRTPDGDLNTKQTRQLFKRAKIKMTHKEKP